MINVNFPLQTQLTCFLCMGIHLQEAPKSTTSINCIHSCSVYAENTALTMTIRFLYYRVRQKVEKLACVQQMCDRSKCVTVRSVN